jgi:hypothetical protein
MFAKPIFRSFSTTMSPVSSARSLRFDFAFSIAAAITGFDRFSDPIICADRGL